MYEMLRDLIKPELLILVPVLYLIGAGLKRSAFFADKWIPAALGGAGVVLACIYLAATAGEGGVLMVIFTGFTQGVLSAGASVYINQLIKQAGKEE